MTWQDYLSHRTEGHHPVMYAGDWSILADEMAVEIERIRAVNADMARDLDLIARYVDGSSGQLSPWEKGEVLRLATRARPAGAAGIPILGIAR